MKLFGLIALAIVVEGLVDWTKEVVKNNKFQWPVIVALIFGEAFAFNYQVDLIAIAGVTGMYPIIGILATGVFLSRGAAYINEIISKLMSYKSKKAGV